LSNYCNWLDIKDASGIPGGVFVLMHGARQPLPSFIALPEDPMAGRQLLLRMVLLDPYWFRTAKDITRYPEEKGSHPPVLNAILKF
jgi:hypothetical protein